MLPSSIVTLTDFRRRNILKPDGILLNAKPLSHMCFLLLCPQKLHSKNATSFITKWPHFLTPALHHYFFSKWACSQRFENFQLPYPRKRISLVYGIAGRNTPLSSSRQGRMLWCSKSKLAASSPPISYKDCTKTTSPCLWSHPLDKGGELSTLLNKEGYAN